MLFFYLYADQGVNSSESPASTRHIKFSMLAAQSEGSIGVLSVTSKAFVVLFKQLFGGSLAGVCSTRLGPLRYRLTGETTRVTSAVLQFFDLQSRFRTRANPKTDGLLLFIGFSSSRLAGQS